MKPSKLDLHQALARLGESPAEPDWDRMEAQVMARIHGTGPRPSARRATYPAPLFAVVAMLGLWALLVIQPWGTARTAARPFAPNRMEQLIARESPEPMVAGPARATYRNPSFERRLAALDLL